MNNFSELLEALRQERQISKKDLAIRAGLTPSYISLLTSGGRTSPSEEVVNALSKVLSLDMETKKLLFEAAGYSYSSIANKIDRSYSQVVRGVSAEGPLEENWGEEGKEKIELVWPGEITHRKALYDPWKMVDEISNTLTGENDQGVLLLGERKFGKSSFFNCVYSLLPKKGENFRAVSLDPLAIHHSLQSFATQLLVKICRRVGLDQSSVPYDSLNKDVDIESFFSAFQSVADQSRGIHLVVCIDEIDSALNNAPSKEDARGILQILYRLLLNPDLPVRLLLTASDAEVLRRSPGGTDFLADLDIRNIPLCSEFQMRDLIERFDVPVTFVDEALNRIFYYSGGQIYLVKLAVKAITAQAHDKEMINAHLVDDLIYDVIEPSSSSSYEVGNLHEAVFPTMSNIYEKHFSADEKQLLQLLIEADGVLRISSVEANEAQRANIANTLYRRGYLSKTKDDEYDVYSWRIGFWQLFLENRYQFKYRKNREQQ